MGKPKILIVEDSPDDEELILRALRKAQLPCEPLVAHDGVEAVELLLGPGSSNGKTALPNMVLLDLKMPRMDGLDVLRRLRQQPRTQKLPVIIFTSSTSESDIQNCREAGATDYVSKPMEGAEFARTVVNIVQRWVPMA